MKFKDERDKIEYRNLALYPSMENIELRKLIEMIEQLSVDSGHGETTITDYIRSNKTSLHHYGQAVDIRVRDKPVAWYIAICKLGEVLALLDKRWRINPHHELFGQPQQHIHLEVRTMK